MGFLKRLAQSADLAMGMAKRLDVDLSANALAGDELAGQHLRAIVMRCAQCSDQQGCARLQAGTTTLAQAPRFCQNADVMRR